MSTHLSVRDAGHVIHTSELGQIRHIALSLKSSYAVNATLNAREYLNRILYCHKMQSTEQRPLFFDTNNQRRE